MGYFKPGSMSRGFRLQSQSAFAVAFTEQKSMGGRAWPHVAFPDQHDYAYALWGNSTIARLLLNLWHAQVGTRWQG